MPQTARASLGGVALRVAGVLGIVAAITLVCSRAIPVNSATAGFAYLVAILFIAARWGLVEAVAGSLAAVACYNFYFLPPFGTFTIADPQNWVALFAFLATSITASHLSARARERAWEALDRQKEMEKLYALSRSILLIGPTQSVPKQLANQVAQSFGARAVTLFDRETGDFHRSGPEDFPGLDDQLRHAALQGTFFQSEAARTLITAIRLGGEPIGSLGISGVELSDSALQGLANLVAIGLERARAQDAASKAEAARQSDELKSTLLDAIAHEFKTPLTAIKAATTALLSNKYPKPEQQSELISIVDEEAERLSELVTQAIQMARIEAGRVHLYRDRRVVRELILSVLDKMRPSLEQRTVDVRVGTEIPPLTVDSELVKLALRLLIDNALKYSPPDSPLTVSAELRDERVIVSVADRGPGIPEAEQTRVFEKFYRSGKSRQQIPGAGLGLAIARDIVQAHAGEIWVESKLGAGSTFCFSLPVAKELEAE